MWEIGVPKFYSISFTNLVKKMSLTRILLSFLHGDNGYSSRETFHFCFLPIKIIIMANFKFLFLFFNYISWIVGIFFFFAKYESKNFLRQKWRMKFSSFFFARVRLWIIGRFVTVSNIIFILCYVKIRFLSLLILGSKPNKVSNILI